MPLDFAEKVSKIEGTETKQDDFTLKTKGHNLELKSKKCELSFDDQQGTGGLFTMKNDISNLKKELEKCYDTIEELRSAIDTWIQLPPIGLISGLP